MDGQKIRFRRAFWWTAFGLWLILTVYLSSQNGSGSSDISGWFATKIWRASNVLTRVLLDRGISYVKFHFYIRKLAHFTVHLILAFTATHAAVWSFSSRKTALRFAIALTVFLALFDEVIQVAAPGRASAMFDGVINIFGVMVGLLISSRAGPESLSEFS